MLAIAVIPQPGANQIEIVDNVYRKLAQIQSTIPPDIQILLGADYTRFVRRSITEVEETIVTAFILVALVIFAFLRDWRSTLIPLTAIPVSLIGAFFIMYLCGFSINVLTLLGIVLAIGLVVDDAIVMLENIYAKIEEGMTPIQAALQGSREIYFAVISTTVTPAAVFRPVIFLSGLTGRLFREFGIVVAGSVIISAFVSLTLTPMLSSRILKGGGHTWLYGTFFEWMISGYENSLRSFLKVRWLAWVLMALFIGIVWQMIRTNAIPSELAPPEDCGQFRIQATAPEGAIRVHAGLHRRTGRVHLARTAPYRTRRRHRAELRHGGRSTPARVARVKLLDSTLRSQQQIVGEITPKIKRFTGAKTFIVQEQTIGSGAGRGCPCSS